MMTASIIHLLVGALHVHAILSWRGRARVKAHRIGFEVEIDTRE